MIYRLLLLFLLLSPLADLQAEDIPLEFDNPAMQERYESLIEEVRCLVCQNQSLADSSADLAQDLRTEIYQMMQAGRSDEEIISFLVERYGDFVLYRPPFKQSTWLLWAAPFVFLIGALAAVVYFVRRSSQKTVVELDTADRERLASLLEEEQKQGE